MNNDNLRKELQELCDDSSLSNQQSIAGYRSGIEHILSHPDFSHENIHLIINAYDSDVTRRLSATRLSYLCPASRFIVGERDAVASMRALLDEVV